jgi:hypothetical protein
MKNNYQWYYLAGLLFIALGLAISCADDDRVVGETRAPFTPMGCPSSEPSKGASDIGQCQVDLMELAKKYNSCIDKLKNDSDSDSDSDSAEGCKKQHKHTKKCKGKGHGKK